MRTRQPPPLVLTGQEIASSNSTLNTLLGGRQKSWMTGSGSDVRPTPRAQVTQRFSMSVLPSPAPSDEPSPEKLPFHYNPSFDIQQTAPQPQSQPTVRQDYRQPTSFSEARVPAALTSLANAPQPYLASESEAQRMLQSQANKRQRTMPLLGNIPSLASRIPVLEEYVRKIGGWDSLGHNVERPRFSLLLDACKNDDYFFLALHQVFCLWSIDPTVVTSIEGFQDSPTIALAFQLICRLIRGNDGISQVHLKWLADFPSNLSDLVARSDHYRRTLSAVRLFLFRISTEKTSVVQQSQQRGYPPLVDEMVTRLGLLSPVLQGVFFTASRRTLGIRDDNIGAQMDKLFAQDRDGHKLLATRYNTAFPPSEREILERNSLLAERYLAMRNSSERQPQPSTSVTGLGEPSLRLGSSPNPQHDTTVQQVAFMNNTSPQIPGVTGVFQIQNLQAGMNIGANSPTAFPAHVPTPSIQNSQKRQQGIVGSALPGANNPYQQPQNYGNNHQIPQQQLRNHSSPISPSSLRSNHNQYPSSMQTTDSYPATSLPGQMQKYPFHQQGSPTFLQSYDLQLRNHQQQQFPQQQTRQRNTNSIAINPTAANMQQWRVNSMPSVSPMTQTPVSGVTNVDQSRAPSAAHRGSRRTDGLVPLKSPSLSWSVPLIPTQGQVLPPHQPNPDLTAAHQAYIRSPLIAPIDIPPQMEKDDPARRRYQAVLDFAVGPVALSRSLPLSVFEFIVPDVIYARISTDRVINPGSLLLREVKQGDIQYRMRCIQMKPGEVEKASDYAVADTVWPACIFMEVNGVPVEVRRKLHHGKDLPADITRCILPVAANVANHVKVSFPRIKRSSKDIDYSFAVEVVEVLQHQQILDMCQANPHIPAGQTIESIKASLSGTLVDDDEISMAVGDLTINLADPFMARIFDTPVRGRNCLHRECFDLETFLKTRQSKPKFPQQPSMVDVWKCPLCGKDARPYSLQVDDFLVSVREKLAEQDLLHTKAIVISADGSWKPKAEIMSTKRSARSAGLDGDDMYDSDDDAATKTQILPPSRLKEMEIIELDDD